MWNVKSEVMNIAYTVLHNIVHMYMWLNIMYYSMLVQSALRDLWHKATTQVP